MPNKSGTQIFNLDPLQPEFRKHLGKFIAYHRKRLKMSQTKLGELIDVTYQQVQKYETGVNNVTNEKLAQISKVLNVNIISEIGEASNLKYPKLASYEIAQALDKLDDRQCLTIKNVIKEMAKVKGED